MKLNRVERWMVNNPVRAVMQRQIVRWMKSRGSLGTGARVLEIGCGRGVGAALLQRYFEPRAIVAVDQIARAPERGGSFFMEEYYPGSYQNLLTRHILKHPGQDRLNGPDLTEALEHSGLRLINRLEIKGFGILGVSRKV